MDWTPVYYFYHGFSFEELTAMYHMADIALVTPLRDGMNLVAKEYVAAKSENPGVLILSEMAGAAVELTDALLINPNDTGQIERAICQALEMPVEEQLRRLQNMQKIISTQTVDKWAADFTDEWNDICRKNISFRKKQITANTIGTIKQEYNRAKKRLILLDYDGTLAALKPRPEDAEPTPELIETLQKLCEDSDNHIVINSGRDHFTLEKWLGNLPVSIAAEHGAFYRENGLWHKNINKPVWSAGLLSILKLFVAKTPRSRLEVKETAIAWHYRESDAWLGTLRAQQLANSEVSRQLKKEYYDFILAIGDDTTDEDMFKALPKNAATIKVGYVSETARYNLPSQEQVLPLLQTLVNISGESSTNDKVRKGLNSALHFFKELLNLK